MREIAAAVRTRSEALTVPYAMPLLLAVNTLVLLGLDRLGAIPSWVKATAAFFLAF